MKRRWLWLWAGVTLAACNCDPTLRGPCSATCDCDQSGNAPLKCPGAWRCNTDKTCQYTCSELCDPADAGCPAGEDCRK
jgi:hypothetical protein